VVSDLNPLDVGADSLDDTCRLVAQQDGGLSLEGAVDLVQVRVTQASGNHPDQDLIGFGTVEVERLDVERAGCGIQDCGSDGEAHGSSK
jgi:hypothetical protein